MPVAVELASPWWLLALPAMAVLLVVARLPWWRAARAATGAARRSALRQEARRLALRLVWTSLLVLALAGTTITRPLGRQAIAFVLDVSASVSAARDQAEALARDAAERLRHGDALGVVVVADGAAVEESPTAEPLFRRLGTAIADEASDLAAGLRLAGALLPEGYVGRVVLVSDGRQTQGDAIAVARDLAARGVAVDVVPLGVAARADVRLEAVEIPEVAYRGETATVRVQIAADQQTTATLRVYRDDEIAIERQVELRSGRQEIAVPVPTGDPGLHRYRIDLAVADPTLDATVANNTLGAIQRVVGPPRVLVVANGTEAAGYLPAAFQAGGAEVSVVAPANVPADLAGWAQYQAVALVDVRADQLPPGVGELIEAYVRDLGRGLVMTGGPDSFGPGGYADTPVEKALPVYVDLRGRGRQPKVALALVIDRSGSMSGMKMELAKEAAARSIRLLREDDQAAVLAFDSVPQWVAPLTPMAERDRVLQAIGGIYAGGGTEIYPALAAGIAMVRDADADVKHVILLTDGQSGSGGDYPALIAEMRDSRVTLSTVAVGEDADTALLEAMARAGRGRYHFAADAAAIPEIFAQETIMATRTILVDARFHPAAASASPLLRGLNAVPPLDGYVAVTPKERAEVVLVSPEGDPVLASWQYGLGRGIAWTPDVGGRWSAAWADGPAATTLWGNILSWLLPPQDSGDLAVQVSTESADTLTLTAENRTDWEEVRPTRATLIGPSGSRQEIELTPSGPGRYQASVERPPTGAYVVQVEQTTAGGVALRGETGWVSPYPAEFRETGIDANLLAQIAAAGGGNVLNDPAEAVRPMPRQAVARWPAWPLLLILAALFWPVEIASRRLSMPRLPTAIPFAIARRRGEASATVEAAAPAPSPNVAAPSEPPGTTERLLERKRSFRDRQRGRSS